MSCMLLKHGMRFKKLASGHDANGFHAKWNDETLSETHIRYAADDALTGYRYQKSQADQLYLF